ncbi:MAG: HNH endonuclease, partial [Fibrella sp.]|nr:HNH endonuclease [Armatimonadota bacterium]
HAPEQVFNGVFEVEHIHPEMRGGTSDYDNLALAVNDANHMIGLTDVGRTTIVRLRLNHDRQINARRHWRSNGIFP